jgi:antirestriction protein
LQGFYYKLITYGERIMEQHPHQGGDLPATPTPERLTDEQLIHYGITEALREERSIDHATARAIAAQLHGGQASALYVLASSGALVEGLGYELDAWRTDDTPVEVEPWLDALSEYLDSRDDPNPIDGWHQLWPTGPERDDDEPDTGDEERPPYGTWACAIGRHMLSASLDTGQAEDDETEARQTLFERISAAGVTTLGEIGTVGARDQEDEPDDFPWVDAATWSSAEVARDNFDEPRHPPDELDVLFGEQPDEEVGSVDELGWYGLVKHEGRPGGLILIQDEQGFRHVREAPNDAALDVQWAAIQQDYQTFYEQRDAYEAATAESSDGPSGHSPRIWVGSLADYNNGQLYGVWMDATLEPDELQAAAQFMLRIGDTPGAEEWAIMDHEGFGGYEVEEYTSFTTVSCIAQGVAEHGEAFAAWVDIVGDSSGDLLDPQCFRDHYEGTYDSIEKYVEYILQETGFYGQLDRALEVIPEDLRRHVKVDVEDVAEEWAQWLHVAEAGDGKVHVFDART